MELQDIFDLADIAYSLQKVKVLIMKSIKTVQSPHVTPESLSVWMFVLVEATLFRDSQAVYLCHLDCVLKTGSLIAKHFFTQRPSCGAQLQGGREIPQTTISNKQAGQYSLNRKVLRHHTVLSFQPAAIMETFQTRSILLKMSDDVSLRLQTETRRRSCMETTWGSNNKTMLSLWGGDNRLPLRKHDSDPGFFFFFCVLGLFYKSRIR